MTPRDHRHQFWEHAYAEQRRRNAIWFGVFTLLMGLIGLLPFAAILVGKYGR